MFVKKSVNRFYVITTFKQHRFNMMWRLGFDFLQITLMRYFSRKHSKKKKKREWMLRT